MANGATVRPGVYFAGLITVLVFVFGLNFTIDANQNKELQKKSNKIECQEKKKDLNDRITRHEQAQKDQFNEIKTALNSLNGKIDNLLLRNQ